MLKYEPHTVPCVCIMYNTASKLTYDPAGGCGHVNQEDYVFGSDAQ